MKSINTKIVSLKSIFNINFASIFEDVKTRES